MSESRDFTSAGQPQDVTGAAAGKGIALHQPHQARGARFSQRSKVLVVGFVVVMFSLIFYGIMMAGQRRHATGNPYGESPGQMRPGYSGMRDTTPPVIPKPLAAASAPAQNDCEKLNNSPWPCAPRSKGAATSALTPEQKYREWLLQQHYKDMQDDVLARRAAIVSEVKAQNLALGGVPSQPGQAVAGITQPPVRKPNPRPPEGLGLSGIGGDLQAAYLGSLGLNNNGAGIDSNKAWQQSAAENRGAGGYLPATQEPPRGNHELFAGSVIPAVLVTAIVSDLPGTITAEVRRTVYDSRDPSTVLIPQKARLVGEYNSMVMFGQERLMVIWNEIIYPDGSTLDLKGMAGVDMKGQAGFHDLVDHHYWRVFGSSALISLFGAAAQMSQPQNSSTFNSPSMTSQATASLATQMNNTAMQVLNKNLNIAPTLNIREGYAFNVMVAKTIVFSQPWGRD